MISFAALLRSVGWRVNLKRVERIWPREGLKVPMKQPKRVRLWFNDGSCVRLRPERPNNVDAIKAFDEECVNAFRGSRQLVAISQSLREQYLQETEASLDLSGELPAETQAEPDAGTRHERDRDLVRIWSRS